MTDIDSIYEETTKELESQGFFVVNGEDKFEAHYSVSNDLTYNPILVISKKCPSDFSLYNSYNYLDESKQVGFMKEVFPNLLKILELKTNQD